jgi:hypothetical protein
MSPTGTESRAVLACRQVLHWPSPREHQCSRVADARATEVAIVGNQDGHAGCLSALGLTLYLLVDREKRARPVYKSVPPNACELCNRKIRSKSSASSVSCTITDDRNGLLITSLHEQAILVWTSTFNPMCCRDHDRAKMKALERDFILDTGGACTLRSSGVEAHGGDRGSPLLQLCWLVPQSAPMIPLLRRLASLSDKLTHSQGRDQFGAEDPGPYARRVRLAGGGAREAGAFAALGARVARLLEIWCSGYEGLTGDASLTIHISRSMLCSPGIQCHPRTHRRRGERRPGQSRPSQSTAGGTRQHARPSGPRHGRSGARPHRAWRALPSRETSGWIPKASPRSLPPERYLKRHHVPPMGVTFIRRPADRRACTAFRAAGRRGSSLPRAFSGDLRSRGNSRKGDRRAWCPGPDSNRHGVAPEGFSCHYSFRCCSGDAAVAPTRHLGSGLYLCRAARALRFRQGPSSLYTFRPAGGLARYCSHPDVLLFHRI